MRKLILWNMVTLDGFFEGAHPWAIRLSQRRLGRCAIARLL
jgi:hypothetical protein